MFNSQWVPVPVTKNYLNKNLITLYQTLFYNYCLINALFNKKKIKEKLKLKQTYLGQINEKKCGSGSGLVLEGFGSDCFFFTVPEVPVFGSGSMPQLWTIYKI